MQSGFPEFISRASFDQPEILVESAWFEHSPFAFHLISTFRPKVFVELGTHHGFSFFSFCQAIQKYSTGTLAFGVDTWQGDEHAGFYGDDVYVKVKNIQQRFNGFSTLIRSTFSEAVSEFADSSIDLLHIDGRHYYEDITEDFEQWLPKLSQNAIVIFHDTNVRERNFGVWRFFLELRKRYPAFEFIHGHGLGVIAIGVIPDELSLFFGADANAGTMSMIRAVYARLGRGVADAYAASRLVELEANNEATAAQIQTLQAALTNKKSEVEQLAEKLAHFDQRVAAAEQLGRRLDVGLTYVREKLPARELDHRIAALEHSGSSFDAEMDRRIAKAERRIRRLTWHAGVLMPITGPIVLILRAVTRKGRKLVNKIKQT